MLTHLDDPTQPWPIDFSDLRTADETPDRIAQLLDEGVRLFGRLSTRGRELGRPYILLAPGAGCQSDPEEEDRVGRFLLHVIVRSVSQRRQANETDGRATRHARGVKTDALAELLARWLRRDEDSAPAARSRTAQAGPPAKMHHAVITALGNLCLQAPAPFCLDAAHYSIPCRDARHVRCVEQLLDCFQSALLRTVETWFTDAFDTDGRSGYICLRDPSQRFLVGTARITAHRGESDTSVIKTWTRGAFPFCIGPDCLEFTRAVAAEEGRGLYPALVAMAIAVARRHGFSFVAAIVKHNKTAAVNTLHNFGFVELPGPKVTSCDLPRQRVKCRPMLYVKGSDPAEAGWTRGIAWLRVKLEESGIPAGPVMDFIADPPPPTGTKTN